MWQTVAIAIVMLVWLGKLCLEQCQKHHLVGKGSSVIGHVKHVPIFQNISANFSGKQLVAWLYACELHRGQALPCTCLHFVPYVRSLTCLLFCPLVRS